MATNAQRIAALEQKVAALEPKVADHERRIDANEETVEDHDHRIGALEATPPPTTPPPTTPPPTGSFPTSRVGVSAIYPTPAHTAPGYLAFSPDPTFDGSVARVTPAGRTGLRNFYAKGPAWSAGDRYLMLTPYQGGANAILDGETFAVVSQPPGITGAPIWSNVDPDLVWGTGATPPPTDNRFWKWRVSTGAQTFTPSLTAYTGFDTTEASISDDDRYLAALAYKSAGPVWSAVLYDTASNVIAKEVVTGSVQPDYAMVSRSGLYLIVNFKTTGSGSTQGTWVYPGKSGSWTPWQLTIRNSHADIGRDASGQDIWVIVTGTDDRTVQARRLASTPTPVIDVLRGSVFYEGHVNARYGRDGWATLTHSDATYTEPAGVRAGYDQVVDVKLDGSQECQVWAHAHAQLRPGVYDGSPWNAPSRDGQRIVFGVRWDGAALAAYVVKI